MSGPPAKTLLDAIAVALAAAPGPLHVRDITRSVLEHKLWETKGKTPEESVSAALATDIVKHGVTSRFVRAAPSTYALSASEIARVASSGSRSSLTAELPASKGSSNKELQASALSFNDAAERVLREMGNGRPLHYRDITKKALEKGWLVTKGRTPEATLYAQIYTDIQRRQLRGQQPRFRQLKGGLIGLAEQLPRGLGREIEDHNQSVKDQLRERLMNLTPSQFEKLVGRLLRKMGLEDVEVTRVYRDGGVDAFGTVVVGSAIRIHMAVQAKKWKPNVQRPVVASVRGSSNVHHRGLIITTSDFSSGAKEEASLPDREPVELMNGSQLVDALVEYEIGVERAPYNLLSLSPEGLLADE